MSSEARVKAGAAGRARLFGTRDWAIWSIAPRVLVSVLTVEFTAVALVLGQVPTTTFGQRDIFYAVLLGFFGVLHTEIAVQVERVRRRFTADTPHVDLSSVWTFAAAVFLPPVLASVVAVVVFTHLWWRSWRPRVALYRHVFSTATIILANLAASAVMIGFTGGHLQSGATSVDLVAIVLALLAYTTVNSCLVGGAVVMSTSAPDLGTLLGNWNDNLLEVATLSLGALAAIAITISPWLLLLVLPPLLVLHQAVLVHHLEEAASTDGKTGLLNAATWHFRADRELQRQPRGGGPRAVLVLDLDHFKGVNDTHGHLAGDQVLSAVADALRSEVRDRDLVGRFGGEEFVVLLAGSHGGDDTDLEAVADRIRRRVAALRVEIPTADGPLTIAGLSISVGGAVHSGGAADLRELLQIAATALYSAKRAGRNMVRMGSLPSSRPPVPAMRVVTESIVPVADAQ